MKYWRPRVSVGFQCRIRSRWFVVELLQLADTTSVNAQSIVAMPLTTPSKVIAQVVALELAPAHSRFHRTTRFAAVPNTHIALPSSVCRLMTGLETFPAAISV